MENNLNLTSLIHENEENKISTLISLKYLSKELNQKELVKFIESELIFIQELSTLSKSLYVRFLDEFKVDYEIYLNDRKKLNEIEDKIANCLENCVHFVLLMFIYFKLSEVNNYEFENLKIEDIIEFNNSFTKFILDQMFEDFFQNHKFQSLKNKIQNLFNLFNLENEYYQFKFWSNFKDNGINIKFIQIFFALTRQLKSNNQMRSDVSKLLDNIILNELLSSLVNSIDYENLNNLNKIQLIQQLKDEFIPNLYFFSIETILDTAIFLINPIAHERILEENFTNKTLKDCNKRISEFEKEMKELEINDYGIPKGLNDKVNQIKAYSELLKFKIALNSQGKSKRTKLKLSDSFHFYIISGIGYDYELFNEIPLLLKNQDLKDLNKLKDVILKRQSTKLKQFSKKFNEEIMNLDTLITIENSLSQLILLVQNLSQVFIEYLISIVDDTKLQVSFITNTKLINSIIYDIIALRSSENNKLLELYFKSLANYYVKSLLSEINRIENDAILEKISKQYSGSFISSHISEMYIYQQNIQFFTLSEIVPTLFSLFNLNINNFESEQSLINFVKSELESQENFIHLFDEIHNDCLIILEEREKTPVKGVRWDQIELRIKLITIVLNYYQVVKLFIIGWWNLKFELRDDAEDNFNRCQRLAFETSEILSQTATLDPGLIDFANNLFSLGQVCSDLKTNLEADTKDSFPFQNVIKILRDLIFRI